LIHEDEQCAIDANVCLTKNASKVSLSNLMNKSAAKDKRIEKQAAEMAITSIAMNPVIEKITMISANDEPCNNPK
jgi:hypothetical protein